MREVLFDIGKSAVLVVDIQKGYCSPQGSIAKLGYGVSHFSKLIPRISKFIDNARKLGVQVIFTRMIEDPAYMEINAKLKMKSVNASAITSPDTLDFEYFKVSPEKGDLEIVKNSYDSFSNKKLEKFLKKKKISNLVILGAYSDVCVDSSVRSAFTKGYNVIVPKDLIGTVEERSAHMDNSVDIWNKFFAHVLSSSNILRLWGSKK
jgi:ureidoacrylate peracid hydrolase